MHNFTYYNPTRVIFGRGVNASVADELAQDGVSKVLLLYGGTSIRRNGLYDEVTGALTSRKIAYFDCGGVKPNPVLSKAQEAVRIIRESGAQAIVAIGGGSVIDSAKAVAVGAMYDGDLWDFYARTAKPERALPVYAVVTVSATASEVNYTSVLMNEALGLKVGLSSKLMYPKVSLIDPSVQATVPERQTVDGGVDAISHVLETYFDGTTGAEVQMEYGEGLVRSLMRLVPILRARPDDYNARAQFAWAAANALNGTTWAGHAGRGDFASHAMGHVISARFDSVHGQTLAAVMPAWMQHVYRADLPAFVRFADRVMGVSSGDDDYRATAGIERLKGYFASLGAPVSLRELGVPESSLPELASLTTKSGPIGVLQKLDADDVLKIYKIAF